jgi:iron complex transport system permease protein
MSMAQAAVAASARPASASVRRVAVVALLLLAALAGLLLLAMMLGVTPIPPEQVVSILLTGEGERVPRLVITTLRLPRALLGALIGAGMALTGVMLQDSLKNALADPGLLGVSTGASLVVAVIVVLNVPLPFASLPVFALAGGLFSGLIIIMTAQLTRDPTRTMLTGAALTALLGALIVTLITLAKPNELRALYSYLVGSMTGRDGDDLLMTLPWLGVGIPLALFFGRALNVLQLGDDMAEGLGVPVFRVRLAILLICVAMTGAIVAAAGPVGFVALIAPHMSRFALHTSDSRQVLPVSALLGAVLMVGCDLLAREIFSPAELPVGLVLIAVGSPIAMVLLRNVFRNRANSAPQAIT